MIVVEATIKISTKYVTRFVLINRMEQSYNCSFDDQIVCYKNAPIDRNIIMF